MSSVMPGTAERQSGAVLHQSSVGSESCCLSKLVLGGSEQNQMLEDAGD